MTCELCQNTENIQFLYKGYDRMHFMAGEFDLYRCGRCGLIFVHPFLTPQTLETYYPPEYLAHGAPKRTFLDGNGKGLHYLTHPFQAANALVYSKILRQNADISTKAGDAVLDIGCGGGAYLLEKQRAGARCYGVDISRETLERIRQAKPSIQTHCGMLWDAGYPSDFFDVITLHHVLEHLKETHRLIAEVRRILKKDGIIRIQIPNSRSLTFRIFGRRWIHLDAPRHVYVFSKRNVMRLFKASSFEIVRRRTIENSFSVIGSCIYLYNDLFKKRHPLAEMAGLWDSECLKLLCAPYCLLVNALGVGDTAEFILKKKERP